MGFPEDRYTPHGYIRNPYDFGPHWGFDGSGTLRSSPACGFGWYDGYETRDYLCRMNVGVKIGSELFLLPIDFSKAGCELYSSYHTINVMSYNWGFRGVKVDLRFFLVDRDALGCIANFTGTFNDLTIYLVGTCTKQEIRSWRGEAYGEYRNRDDVVLLYTNAGPWYALKTDRSSTGHEFSDSLKPMHKQIGSGELRNPGRLALNPLLKRESVVGTLGFDGVSGPLTMILARGGTREEAVKTAQAALSRAAETYESKIAEDTEFWDRAPRLAGDWPGAWRRSWIYDLETTRMCLFPPAGVFERSWPTWMIYRPRIVLAENVLDMMRLSYAAPEAAQDTVLHMFETAPEPNVPCIRVSGGYDMVARDGSTCGTSPAWCLPFHNIYLMYLRHLDHKWLAKLYPYLCAYLDWWLAHRTDEDGWGFYKCTWESGEDGSPRLDPRMTGDRDISNIVIPVEVQACIAHSAKILSIFAGKLGNREDVERWQAVFETYRDKTRALWDNSMRKFRDRDRRTDDWLNLVPESPLSLTPLLYGVATEEQMESYRSRLGEYRRPPVTIWPSEALVTLEAGTAIGCREVCAELAYSLLERVYQENDRREFNEIGPLPGAAREYWPEDLRGWDAAECYGWGATTMSILLRQIVGFVEHEETDGTKLRLAPSLPEPMRTPGATYRVENLHYRGVGFDLSYRVAENAQITVEITHHPRAKVVSFSADNFAEYTLSLVSPEPE
ncbi:MAG: trehalase family glycosidase [Candidatus Bipolaricaulia bacterium]